MTELPDTAPDDVLLCAVAGSTGFGLARADSDIDLHGIFRVPTADVLGIHKIKESYVNTKPDVTLHEIGKFVRLALKANPTILETLYFDKYVITTPEGRLLIENRGQFLCERHVRNAYLGYARSQLGSNHIFPTAKAARHAIRILDCGIELLTTGTMKVDRSDNRDELFGLGSMSQTNFSRFEQEFMRRANFLENCETDLPEEPNTDLFNELVIEIRRRAWLS